MKLAAKDITLNFNTKEQTLSEYLSDMKGNINLLFNGVLDTNPKSKESILEANDEAFSNLDTLFNFFNVYRANIDKIQKGLLNQESRPKICNNLAVIKNVLDTQYDKVSCLDLNDPNAKNIYISSPDGKHQSKAIRPYQEGLSNIPTIEKNQAKIFIRTKLGTILSQIDLALKQDQD